MADEIELTGHVRGIPANTTEVLDNAYSFSRMTNGGPGIAVIDGDVVRPGGMWTPKFVGQTKVVVSTLDTPARIGTL